MYKLLITIFIFCYSVTSEAIVFNTDSMNSIIYFTEINTSFSNGNNAPFWIQSNKHGLSSIKTSSGYLRTGLFYNLSNSLFKKNKIKLGIDIAIPQNYTSNFIIQQLFADIHFKNIMLSIGSKERKMELKNNELSTGSQTLGINARPIPQVRIDILNYQPIPYTNKWLHIKGHLSYGKMTDDNWQHTFTEKKNKYTDNVLFHSKAGYIKVENTNKLPYLSLEIGLEKITQFGGTTYIPNNNGEMIRINNPSGLEAFWNALIPNNKGDAYENKYDYSNVEGNYLGSWMMRLNYNTPKYSIKLYADHFFEDHSGMFFLDYDGYGTGEKWNVKDKNRYILYDFKDMLLGLELSLKNTMWLNNVVIEYINTQYQSGPIYHDHNQTTPDHIGGNDNYYNHFLYPGWQHWGQVIGNPLYLSPIYNKDGILKIKDNRFKAYHIGINGYINKIISYKFLLTHKTGLGTYDLPFNKHLEQTSLLLGINYKIKSKKQSGWSIKTEYACDFGDLIGENYGINLKITKMGLIKTK